MANITFNLSEETDLAFNLAVKGSASGFVGTPLIRFIISEANGSMAIVLPARPTGDDGKVSVTIPPLKSVFSEDKDYVGKLEIIVGDRYFAPTSMNINFIRGLDMEAKPTVTVKRNGVVTTEKVAVDSIAGSDEEDETLLEANIASVIKSDEVREIKKKLPNRKPSPLESSILAAALVKETSPSSADDDGGQAEKNHSSVSGNKKNDNTDSSKEEEKKGILAKNVKGDPNKILMGDEAGKPTAAKTVLTAEEKERQALKEKLKAALLGKQHKG